MPGRPRNSQPKHAFARQDVARRAAVDGPDVVGRVGRDRSAHRRRAALRTRAPAGRSRSTISAAAEMALAPSAGCAECASTPATTRSEGRDALVGVGDLHHRRLADDHRRRARQIDAEAADEVERAEAGGLLVVAQQQMDRLFEPRRQETGGGGERASRKALHVDRAATEKLAVGLAQLERIGAPRLAFDRDDVGVAGQAGRRRRPPGRRSPTAPPCRRRRSAPAAARPRARADSRRRSRSVRDWSGR